MAKTAASTYSRNSLIKKCFLLFRAVGLVSVLPTWQYDWKAVFREAWIPPMVPGRS